MRHSKLAQQIIVATYAVQISSAACTTPCGHKNQKARLDGLFYLLTTTQTISLKLIAKSLYFYWSFLSSSALSL